MDRYEISIIIPCYNEERFIKMCLNSIYEQSLPMDNLEILVIDGMSNDRTVAIVKQEIEAGRSNIKLLENPRRIQASAMNIGVRHSRGTYIVRMDAHSTYSRDYVEKCIALAKETGADNVGGISIATARSRTGKAISLALSCPFGVGNSVFRLGGINGEVESVPFGTFPKTTFKKFGLLNESLDRCEDKEYNQRIRHGGGRIVMSKEIMSYYHNRETIGDLAKQSYNNGRWNMYTLALRPSAVSLRHLVPLMFVISLLVFSALSLAGFFAFTMSLMFAGLLLLDLGLYLALNIIFSLKLSRKNSPSYGLLLPLIFVTMHISYGIGSIQGLCTLPRFIFKVGNEKGSLNKRN